MGWMMVFWVVLIVTVPTILWFLLSERRRVKEKRGNYYDTIILRRYLLGDIDLEEYERKFALLCRSTRRKNP